MKNNTVYTILLGLMVMLVALFGLLLRNRGDIPAGQKLFVGATSTSQVSQGAPKQQVPLYSNKQSFKTSSQVSLNVGSVDYVAKLNAAQTSCRDAVSKQYTELYSGKIESSGSINYFNPVSGSCYMKVTGQVRSTYSATTTGVMYFLKVGNNSPLAECVNVTGMIYEKSAWKCTDKITNQVLQLAQFNDLISRYASR